jgi:glycosyltransferase involved in cell wall biosynthesis
MELQRRRIALLVEASSAGVGRHVIDLGEQLMTLGHEVHLLYSPFRADKRFLVGVSRLMAAGAIALEINIAHAIHPSDIRAITMIRRHLRRHGPFDLLHAHSSKAGFLGRVAAVSRCRAIYTPHAFLTMSLSDKSMRYQCVRTLERVLSLLCTDILCVSSEERAHAKEIGINSNKLQLVWNGIDAEDAAAAGKHREAVRSSIGLRANELCIGFVGRLCPQKAPDLLVEAFARLAANASMAKLCIVGDGPLLPELRRQALRLGVHERTIFTGACDGLTYMSAFDIFALPSQYEGFPYVMVEALAMGLPIVSTRVGGSSALVAPDQNGYLVEPGDTVGFSCALERLLKDASVRSAMASASLQRSSLFTVQRMAAETMAVYQRKAITRPALISLEKELLRSKDDPKAVVIAVPSQKI